LHWLLVRLMLWVLLCVLLRVLLWVLLMRHENSRCRCHVWVMRGCLGMLRVL